MEAIKRSKTSASLVGARIGPTKAETGTYRVTLAVDEQRFEQELTLARRCGSGRCISPRGTAPASRYEVAPIVAEVLRLCRRIDSSNNVVLPEISYQPPASN